MKRKLYFSLVSLFCSICLLSSLFATEDKANFDNCSSYKKIYVNTQSIIINDQGILMVDHSGNLQPVSAVSIDSQGLFVFLPQFWYCDRCQREHWGACPMDY